MGMSASQMRYIMISGKKNDIEFQGQQINQQRTTLATESSTLNSNLLNLTVPTPPSADEYTKVTYTFSSNGSECTVKSLVYNSTTTDENHKAGYYTLNYAIPVTGPQAAYSHNAIVQKSGDNYQVYMNGSWQTLTNVADEEDEDKKAADKSNINRLTDDTEGIDKLKDYEDYDTSADKFYKYEVGGSTKYMTVDAMDKAIESTGSGDVPVYYVNETASYSKRSEIYNCQNPTYSSSGRLESIQDSEGNTINMTVSTEKDEDAYDSAYNEYLYQKEQYNKEMDNINAQLEVIQAQDKKLELKLSDLDTQQSAIQTEMDAVKKVIDKNIETTFKTFA